MLGSWRRPKGKARHEQASCHLGRRLRADKADFCGCRAQAQTFPDLLPIKLIVPYPARLGPSDTMARFSARASGLRRRTLRPVTFIIENVVGAGGKDRHQGGHRAPTPDGYHAVQAGAASTNTPSCRRSLRKVWTLRSGFQRLASRRSLSHVRPLILQCGWWGGASLGLPAPDDRRWAGCVLLAKDHPGKLTSGSTIGIAPHLLLEFVRARTGDGFGFFFSPYKGVRAPAIPLDVLAPTGQFMEFLFQYKGGAAAASGPGGSPAGG